MTTDVPRQPAASAAKITRHATGRRTPVNEHQARHLAQLVRLLEHAVLDHYRVPVAARLPADRHAELFKLEAYRVFVEGAYACGFVCRDLKPDNPLDGARDRSSEAIAAWTFPVLRRYVHYLVRHERWAEGYSSPIFDALVAGHLQQVADRLERDVRLYA